MKTMFQEIALQKAFVAARYNWTPSGVFIGRKEILRLRKEAKELGFECDNAEGAHRPEVWGLLVYEVNTDEPFLEVL